MTDIDEILKERGARYGKFSGHAAISQNLKEVVSDAEGSHRLTPSQREAVSMICHKMARILNGDPNHVDSWADISGYAQLIVKQLEGDNP